MCSVHVIFSEALVLCKGIINKRLCFALKLKLLQISSILQGTWFYTCIFAKSETEGSNSSSVVYVGLLSLRKVTSYFQD